MDRSLLGWNVPNMITVWLMLILLLVVYGLIAQFALKWFGGNSSSALNDGGN